MRAPAHGRGFHEPIHFNVTRTRDGVRRNMF
jgi:hypothetical protein